MKNAHPKVQAAATGSAVAGAVATLLNVILFHTTGYNPSPAEVGAEVTVLAAAGGFIAGYRKQA